jgi:hypothetical protein
MRLRSSRTTSRTIACNLAPFSFAEHVAFALSAASYQLSHSVVRWQRPVFDAVASCFLLRRHRQRICHHHHGG